jgi:hypothetical protein
MVPDLKRMTMKLKMLQGEVWHHFREMGSDPILF